MAKNSSRTARAVSVAAPRTDDAGGGRGAGWMQRLLFAAGLIGLISLDQNIIRWSRLANWVVEAYREVVEPVRLLVVSLIGFDVPPVVFDLMLLAGIIFAAANVHSLRRSGTLVFWEGLKLFFLEQIRQKSANHLLEDVNPAFARVAAAIAIGTAYALPALVVIGGYRGEPFLQLSTQEMWFCYLFLVLSFGLLSSLDNRVPHNDPNLLQNKKFQILVVASALLFPIAIYRYLAFVFYCIVILILIAWRIHLYLLGAFLLILMLNEFYFCIVDKTQDRPECLIYSVPMTCETQGHS